MNNNAIRYLPWDSELFAYKVGKIVSKVDAVNFEDAKKQGYKLLYLSLGKADKKTENYYVKLGAKLVDEKVTFLRKLPNIIERNLTQVKLYEQSNVPEALYSLALQSGIYSRFKIDENFKNKEYEKLYSAWIENSVNKEIAKEVIISEVKQKIVALLTLGVKNDRADIGILAVDKNYRGLGIAYQLIEKAFEQSKILQQTHIQVVTQKANATACHFYQKQGFEIEKVENIYHFWL